MVQETEKSKNQSSFGVQWGLSFYMQDSALFSILWRGQNGRPHVVQEIERLQGSQLVVCRPFMWLLIPFMRAQSSGFNHLLKDSSFNTFPWRLKLQHEFWRGKHLNHSTCCVLFYALCIWPSPKDKCRVLSKSTVVSPHGSLFLLCLGFLQANFSAALRPLLAPVLILSFSLINPLATQNQKQ